MSLCAVVAPRTLKPLSPLSLKITSRYPRDELVRLIDTTIDALRTSPYRLDLHDTALHIKNTRSNFWTGHAYEVVPSMSSADPDARYLITMGITTSPRAFPRWQQGYGDGYGGEGFYPMYARDLPEKITPRIRTIWPPLELLDWRMCFVFLLAHEGQHITQYREDLIRSEVECHWASYEALTRVFGNVPTLDGRQPTRHKPNPKLRKTRTAAS